MSVRSPLPWLPLSLVLALPLACVDDDVAQVDTSGTDSESGTGDGDGDAGDGDGDSGDGDGDIGDGDGDSGDGDGDSGDGDGDPGDGDGDTGDGDGDSGDGDGDPGDGDGDIGDGDGDPGDGDGDPGDGDGDPGDGDGDTGDGDGEGNNDDGTLCPAAGWALDEVVGMFVDETTATVTMLRADGSSFALDTSFPDADPDAEIALVSAATSNLVFVAVYDDLPGLGHNLAHYRVYERNTGAIVWEYVDAMWEPEGRRPYLSEDGRVALFVYSSLDDSDNSYSQVLGEDGPIDLFQGLARGKVNDDDWMQIGVGEDYPRWRNVVTQEQLSPAYPQYNGWSGWTGSDATLAHLSVIDGSIYWVQQRVNEVELTPWPELEPYLFQGWDLASASYSTRIIQVRNGDERRLLRLLDDDVSEEWDLFGPPDHFKVECNSSVPFFDSQDRMILPWRDADSARVFVRPTPGEDWSLLPDMLPVAENYGSGQGHNSGTYTFRGYAQGEKTCFFPGEWADPPPEALLGSSIQILRPANGTHIQGDYGAWPSLASEGRCSARPLSADPAQHWRIDDLVNQSWVEAPLPGRLTWLPN